jgi:hypothetical protein
MTQDNDEQPGEKKRKVAKTALYKVAKTMLFRKSQTDEPVSQLPEAAPVQPPEQPRTKVAKTVLDHQLIAKVREQFEERENERLQEELTKRELEPVKIIPPIQADRQISSCPFSWTEEAGKQRLKHCDNCQAPIYRLDGMEIEEVEGIILRRENKDKFVLYGRPDGKFMTSDCPIAHRRRVQILGLAAVVAVCIIVALAGFMLMPQTPAPSSIPAPTATTTEEAPAPTAVTPKAAASSKGTSSSTGTHHYEAGDPIPVVPAAEPSKIKQPEKTFSEQEQKGEFWQFPNGQPADDFTRSSGSEK